MNAPVAKRQSMLDLDAFERQLRRLSTRDDLPSDTGETNVCLFGDGADQSVGNVENVDHAGILHAKWQGEARPFPEVRKLFDGAERVGPGEAAAEDDFAEMMAALLDETYHVGARSESHETHPETEFTRPEARPLGALLDTAEDRIQRHVSVRSEDLQDALEKSVDLPSAPRTESELAVCGVKFDSLLSAGDDAISDEPAVSVEPLKSRRRPYAMAAVLAVPITMIAVAASTGWRGAVTELTSPRTAIARIDAESGPVKMRAPAVASVEASGGASSGAQDAVNLDDKDAFKSAPTTTAENISRIEPAPGASAAAASSSVSPRLAAEAPIGATSPAVVAGHPLTAPIAHADDPFVKGYVPANAEPPKQIEPGLQAAAPSLRESELTAGPAVGDLAKTTTSPPASTAKKAPLKPAHAAAPKTTQPRHETKASTQKMVAKAKPVDPQPVAPTPTPGNSPSFLDALVSAMTGTAR